MKTIFIVMDSLNRHYLNTYNPSSWVKTPNLDRLAARSLVFDNHYCCSMPCMPARRDLFTGRINFLETPWAPIQPWDDCLQPELRRQQGVYSHLITDHYHYFHSGGEGYHTRFDSWEFQRGQESDAWNPLVESPEPPPFKGRNTRSYWANREFIDPECDEDYPTPQCFLRAIEFLENNHEADNWHLHVEVFDPHEPFVCPTHYRELYEDHWEADYHFDWPPYGPVAEDPAVVDHIRKCYAATLSMADAWLGRLLDRMDELGSWQDTVLVLTTDHGHLLSEHGYWAKNYMFDYQELVHIPLLVCAPGVTPRRVSALTSAIDLMPTFMELYGAQLPPHVHGRSLRHLFDRDHKHHDAVLYGYFGKDVNMTDGRHTYCRQPLPGSFVYHHTAMPCGFRDFHSREQMAGAACGVFLKNTYGIPHFRFKVESHRHHNAPDFHPLYDLANDPQQQRPIHNGELEARMAAYLKDLLDRYEAPECQAIRLGL